MLDSKLPRKMKHMYTTKTITFHFVSYISTYIKTLTHIADSLKNKAGTHIIIVSGGSWDLAFRTLDGFLLKLHKLLNCFKRMKLYKKHLCDWECCLCIPRLDKGWRQKEL